MESTEALRRAIDQTQTIVDAITPDQMEKPTPCSDFNVKALLNHVVVSMQEFAKSASGEGFDFAAYGKDALGTDHRAAFRDAGARLRDAAASGAGDRDWSMGSGPLPGDRGLAMTAMEITQHGWDLARATGQEGVFDEELCETVLELARQNMPPDEQRSPQAFGTSVPIGDDAPAHDRLAAFMGRTP